MKPFPCPLARAPADVELSQYDDKDMEIIRKEPGRGLGLGLVIEYD